MHDQQVHVLCQHESTTNSGSKDGRHVFFLSPKGMQGQAITMHDVTSPLLWKKQNKKTINTTVKKY